jgi:hypothetical protein
MDLSKSVGARVGTVHGSSGLASDIFVWQRRSFLHGVSTIALTLFFSKRTFAREAVSKFNGGRSQIQTWSPFYGGDFPFLNCMKTASTWTYAGGPNKEGAVDPRILNSDGYPTKLDGAGVHTTFRIPSQAERPGRYAITWKGNGTISLNMNNTNQTGSKTSAAGSGRYEFDTNSTAFDVSIVALSNPVISDMKVFHLDDEAALLRGEIFGSRFKLLLRQANCGVFRFLDWQDGNVSNVTTWATRKPISYFSYSCQEYRASLYAGITTNIGNNYSIEFGAGAPTDKQIIHLRFNTNATYVSAPATITQSASPAIVTYPKHPFIGGELICFSGKWPQGVFATNYYVVDVGVDTFKIATSPGGVPVSTKGGGSSSLTLIRPPTLNLNRTGAIPIKFEWGDTVDSFNQPKATDSGGKVIYVTLVYDAALGSWLKFGSGLSSGIRNGIPPEICLRLCVELGMHPYFVTPYLTIDPATDYMSNLAAYCRDNAPTWMVPRFEGCNETWNFAGGFFATRYGWIKAFKDWESQYDTNNWYGKIVSVLGQLISKVYSNDRSRYQILCSVQSGSGQNAYAASTNDPRLTSARFVAHGGTPAHNWVTHICCAQYISPTERGTLQELIDAFKYSVTYSSNPTMRASIVKAYIDTLAGSAGAFNLAYNLTNYTNLKAWGSNWGVQKMCGYEGGYSPDYNGTNWSSVINGASNSSKCVLYLSATNPPGKGKIVGNAAVVGMKLNISGVEGMIQLNGLEVTIVSVSGDDVTIDVDSSSFGIYASGGVAVYVDSGIYVNNLRAAGKYSPNLQGFTLRNYENFLAAGGEFPSCYMLAGPKNVWSIFDPNIYAIPSVQWAAIIAFNH